MKKMIGIDESKSKVFAAPVKGQVNQWFDDDDKIAPPKSNVFWTSLWRKAGKKNTGVMAIKGRVMTALNARNLPLGPACTVEHIVSIRVVPTNGFDVEVAPTGTNWY